MPNWEKIQREWETSKITLTGLADKHGVKLGTLKSRKSRDGWTRDATKNQKVATSAKRMQPKKEEFEPVVESVDITDKQRLFCVYYIKYFNATKAYQKAYECDYMTAQSIAYRLMGNDGVKAEIQRLKQQRLSDAYFDKYDVLQKYKDIAFANIGDYIYTETGYVIELKPLGELDMSIVSEVSNTENGPKIKLADKMKALDVLAKYTDLLSNHDKKRLQEEKFKADIEKTKAEISHIKGGEGKYEDDGFLDAINSKTSNVWREANE